MPEWLADAIIISVRPHGEGNAVVSLLTADMDAMPGLCGGASKKMRGMYSQVTGRASWRARLSEQLGQMRVELTQAVAARLLDRQCGWLVHPVCALLEGFART